MNLHFLRAGVLASAMLVVSVLGDMPVAGAEGSARRLSAAEEANREAAKADATDLLSRLQLPAGSTYSSAMPAGTSRILDEPIPPPTRPKTLVYRRAWWTLPDKPKATLRWIIEHPPSGSKLYGQSEISATGEGEADVAEFGWNPVPGELTSRSLSVSVAKRADGSTVLREDVAVAWTVPHPPSERIPSTARVLDLTRTSLKGDKRRVAISDPRAVHEIAALIDGLPVLQPSPFGVIPCPVELPSKPRTVRLTFRASPHGRPLAQAEQVFEACESALHLNIRGRPQMPLERDGLVLRRLKAMFD